MCFSLVFLSLVGKENIKCIDKTHSWFEAQTTCLFDKGYLINDKSTSCMDGNEDYWIGHFAVDALTWNNGKKS